MCPKPSLSEPASYEVISKQIRRKKVNKAYRTMTEKTLASYGKTIDIPTQTEQNSTALLKRLRENDNGTCIDDFFGCQLPDGFSRNISWHANIIFEQTYLQPFTVSVDQSTALPPEYLRSQALVQRSTHGAMHATRVSAWTLVIANLYRKYGDKDALKLTQEDMLLIQIAALFHDSARCNEGTDFWDNQSGENCYHYFLRNGIDEERARIFSNAARHKDTKGIKSIAHKLIHDADAMDIMRIVSRFRLDELDFYKDIAKHHPAAHSDLARTALAIRGLLSDQSDIGHNLNEPIACITITDDDATVIENGQAVSTCFNVEKKKQYEHAPNCYIAVTADITNHPFLSSLSIPIQATATRPASSLPLPRLLKKQASTLLAARVVSKPKIASEQFAIALQTTYQRLFHFDNSSPTQAPVISNAEKGLLSAFLEMDFYLHHTTLTKTFDAITTQPVPALRGLAERTRWREATTADHTGNHWGIRDNVFMGICIGMSHFSNPAFLKEGDITTVMIHIRTVLQHAPHALDGLWASDHFGYYPQEIDPSKSDNEIGILGGTEFCWRHVRARSLTPQQLSKEILCRDADGIRIQRLNMGDEISSGKNFWLSFGLRFIERLRHLGKENPLRQYLLEHPHDQRMMAATLNELFRVDHFEVKIPTSILLNQPGICILSTQSSAKDMEKNAFIRNKLPLAEVLSRTDIARAVGEAAANGNIQVLTTYLNKGYPLEGHFYRLTDETLPLVKAIENHQSHTVQWLIDQGANQKCFEGGLIGAKAHSALSKVNLEKAQILASAYQSPKMMEILNLNGFDASSIFVNHTLLSRAAALANTALFNMIVTGSYKGEDAKNHKLGHKALIDAAIYGNLEAIKKLLLLTGNEALSLLDESGHSVIHFAVQHSHNEVLAYLIDLDSLLVNLQERKGRTPLHVAVVRNQLSTVKVLIERNANAALQTFCEFGSTPLHYAMQKGNREIVTYLIHHNPALLLIPNKKGSYPIHQAMGSNQVLLIRELITLSVDITLQIADESGYTILHIAAQEGYTESVEDLVKYAPILLNFTDRKGRSPLHVAAAYNQLDFMKKLLEFNADVSLQSANARGYNALHYAVQMGNKNIIEHLLNHAPFLVDSFSKNGRTPLHLAAMEGQLEVVIILLAWNADVTVQSRDELGYTPIHYAVRYRCMEVIAYLMKYRPTLVNSLDRARHSPLHLALVDNNTSIIEILTGIKHVQEFSTCASGNEALSSNDSLSSRQSYYLKI